MICGWLKLPRLQTPAAQCPSHNSPHTPGGYQTQQLGQVATVNMYCSLTPLSKIKAYPSLNGLDC